MDDKLLKAVREKIKHRGSIGYEDGLLAHTAAQAERIRALGKTVARRGRRCLRRRLAWWIKEARIQRAYRDDCLNQKYDEHVAELARIAEMLESDRNTEQQARIEVLEAEVEMYRRHMQQGRHVNMTPDDGMVRRILAAYIDGSTVTDNMLGLPPDNWLCVQMNEWQQERNALLRAALAKLGVPDELK